MGISHDRDIVCHRGRNRKARPQTFINEEKAKIWANSKNIKKYKLVKLNDGLSKKFKIISE